MYNIYSIDHDSLSSSSSSTCCEASEIDYPFKSSEYPIRIVGSCNGLVCIIPDEGVICFWNPLTKEYKELPKPGPFNFPITAPTPYSKKTAYGYGFGYDCNADDYKFVKLMSFGDYEEGFHCVCQVYSLQLDSWKIINDTPSGIVMVSASAQLFNGALHWIMMRSGTEVVVSFDIGDETFKDLPLPQNFEYKSLKRVGALGKYFYMLDSDIFDTNADVWVMKDYGVRESWVKLFTIPNQALIKSFLHLRVIQSFRNDEVLLQPDYANLVMYDPNHERARILEIHGGPKMIVTVTYIGSLVSLN